MSVTFKRSATIAVLITGVALCLAALACGKAEKLPFDYAGFVMLILLLPAVLMLYRLDSRVRRLSRDNMEQRELLAQTEEMLRRSEKLAVIGQLAAGVAHEIRNPLTTLRGFVQLQRTRKESSPEQLEIMLAELDRINFIVSEFLILSKPQNIKFQLHDSGAIVRDVVNLLEPQANMSGIALVARIDERLPKIKCECNQLKQVLINLVKNAVESMTEGGSVTIRADRASADCIRIRIVDQGCGMAEDQLKRLGEPFFTNKPGGTGLGLMICQQIIASHKGELRFNSEPGKGTSVEIVLPVSF
ncbi:ATP-binding protein [Paenibacillus cymbidii]|uniref:ATP-binding protein n=1 Tax=Paenibacillus cymbidii TaxID=1639034 RepID=UPI001436C29E|nr:ATP-binding protein [Paenibacillus cymbidii]